jgi:hypothetical protein
MVVKHLFLLRLIVLVNISQIHNKKILLVELKTNTISSYCDTTSYNSLLDVAPPLTSGKELYDVVSQYNNIVFGFQFGKQKFPGFSVTHN